MREAKSYVPNSMFPSVLNKTGDGTRWQKGRSEKLVKAKRVGTPLAKKNCRALLHLGRGRDATGASCCTIHDESSGGFPRG
jgi:hypothetical protein